MEKEDMDDLVVLAWKKPFECWDGTLDSASILPVTDSASFTTWTHLQDILKTVSDTILEIRYVIWESAN